MAAATGAALLGFIILIIIAYDESVPAVKPSSSVQDVVPTEASGEIKIEWRKIKYGRGDRRQLLRVRFDDGVGCVYFSGGLNCNWIGRERNVR